MGHLDGKVAVVTGAAMGMGRAVAITFAQQGAKVVAWDLGVTLDGRPMEDNPVHKVVEEIKAAGGTANHRRGFAHRLCVCRFGLALGGIVYGVDHRRP